MKTIISAEISAMPKTLFEDPPTVTATFTDGTEKELFYFYPDEISFSAGEFIGLTEAEAHKLRYSKDIACLASWVNKLGEYTCIKIF